MLRTTLDMERLGSSTGWVSLLRVRTACVLIMAFLATANGEPQSLPGLGGSQGNTTYSWTTASRSSSAVSSSSMAMGDFIAAGIGQSASSTAPSADQTLQSSPKLSSNGSVDTCWSEWVSYWNATSNIATQTASGCSYSSYLTTGTNTSPGDSGTTYTTTVTQVSAQTNGPFTLTASATTQTTVVTIPYWGGTTETYTESDHTSFCEYTPDTATITTPPCALPTSVSQCQAEWSAFVASGYQSDTASSPICSQASVDRSMCSWFQSSYVERYNGYSPIPGLLTGTLSNGYAVNTASGGWYWPSSSSLAPGCTLGCARCAVTGGTVQVLYWPQATAAPAITEKIVATYMNTTLTYPTVSNSPQARPV